MDWNGGKDYGMDYAIFKKNVQEHFSIAAPGSAVWLFTY